MQPSVRFRHTKLSGLCGCSFVRMMIMINSVPMLAYATGPCNLNPIGLSERPPWPHRSQNFPVLKQFST